MPLVRKPIPGVVYPSKSDVDAFDALGLFDTRTMATAYSDVARQHPERIALSDHDVVHTHAELDDLTDRVAAGLLDLGLRSGDRAAFQIPNSRELVIALLACLKAGVIPICTLAAHRAAEIGYLSRHAGARAHLICTDDPKFDFAAFARKMQDEVPSLEHIIVARGEAGEGMTSLTALASRVAETELPARLADVPDDPAQVALFQLSGGTSGVPKIIPRFHNEYLYQMRNSGDLHGQTHATVAFSPAPMMHNAPIICYWGPALWRGGHVVCAPNPTPAALAELIALRRPTWMSVPLPMLVKMKAEGVLEPAHFAGVRMCTAAHAYRLAELTGADVVPLYGMTEGMISFGLFSDTDDVRKSTVGRPTSPHDQYRIVDPDTGEHLPNGCVGEFEFTGPSATRGYFDAEDRNREAFAADGWVKSGDLMKIHAIGGERILSFEGRVKDVVSRGGEKINCQEVERALASHPGVGAIACVPMPDQVFGERMCAFVIPAAGTTPPTVAGLGAHLEAAGLAKFKWPERVEIVSEFPQTSSGKTSKPLLRELIARQLTTEPAAS
ncbi:AMP-binding protein [Pseudooceanicola nitratireducens]|uniref:AMP-binding protein n=1 Tax=Pseudooceanicola nitratireducens TaxID=517719 RepID=UPI0031063A19